jgi:ankyrin repeat protein
MNMRRRCASIAKKITHETAYELLKLGILPCRKLKRICCKCKVRLLRALYSSYPSTWSAVSREVKIMRDLLAKRTANDSLLHFACWNDEKTLFRVFLNQGENVNSVNSAGSTSLHIACEKVFRDLITELVIAGADVNQPNHQGNTSLHLACERGDENIVKFLVEKGANINIVNEFGDSPLLIAIRSGLKNVVRFLLSEGSVVNCANTCGSTPLHVACAAYSYYMSVVRNEDCEYMMKLLIAAGADVNIKDAQGNSPLHITIQSGLKNVVRFLLSEGSD